eukprot:scaffold117180_cov62-Phaeocystis_antarctica.AAC.4
MLTHRAQHDFLVGAHAELGRGSHQQDRGVVVGECDEHHERRTGGDAHLAKSAWKRNDSRAGNREEQRSRGSQDKGSVGAAAW